MYIAKNKINIKNQQAVAKKLGINYATLNSIINCKRSTKKITALAILKEYDKKAKLEDYFEKNIVKCNKI